MRPGFINLVLLAVLSFGFPVSAHPPPYTISWHLIIEGAHGVTTDLLTGQTSGIRVESVDTHLGSLTRDKIIMEFSRLARRIDPTQSQMISLNFTFLERERRYHASVQGLSKTIWWGMEGQGTSLREAFESALVSPRILY